MQNLFLQFDYCLVYLKNVEASWSHLDISDYSTFKKTHYLKLLVHYATLTPLS